MNNDWTKVDKAILFPPPYAWIFYGSNSGKRFKVLAKGVFLNKKDEANGMNFENKRKYKYYKIRQLELIL